MDILFLSHCVPYPPDKGERIRAFHELTELSKKHRVHLICFARSRVEMEQAEALQDRCASVCAVPLAAWRALAGASCRFALGQCLTTSFYRSRHIWRRIASLRSIGLAATVSYSSAMAQYAPPDIPLWLDMVDVDSEKWMQYGRTRRPGLPYRIEARRLRTLEARFAMQAQCTWLATALERQLMQDIAPRANIACVGNGVDFDYFNPELPFAEPSLRGRRYILFLGSMDYYPNVDACCWFAQSVFADLKRLRGEMEFLIVGRNPSRAVLRLAKQDGVLVTGAVADVRPYLAAACAVVAPLRIARGVQNKVLEALAMGKCVYASPAVAGTFGGNSPTGLTACDSAADYVQRLIGAGRERHPWRSDIRRDAQERFSWPLNFQRFTEMIEGAAGRALVLE